MSFKRILSVVLATFIGVLASAQQRQESYTAAYKRIDSLLEKQGLTASALKEVDKLYVRAKNENNSVQLIKALIYKVEIQQATQEDAHPKNIAMVETEITTSAQPAKSILQNLAASLYWKYFQRMRYRLYNRTETTGFNKEDISTWSTDDFHKKISELFLASLSNEKLLQQTWLQPFDPIIIKGNVRPLRPTLYDLLAHHALEYFENDERTITKPAYAFEIDDAVAYSNAATFAGSTFTTKDSLSLHFKALQLYQRLIRFHLDDSRPDALVDVDIKRLEFVNRHGVMENKDSLYKEALERITGQYGSLTVAAQAWFLLAGWYAQKAGEYDPQTNPAYRYAYLEAKKICEQVTAQKDSSEGWANCKNLLNEITRPELNLQTEKINIPNQPFRSLVTWRNFNQLHIRVVEVNRDVLELLKDENRYQDEFWKKLVELPALKTFSQSLPDARDHQQHHVEMKTDALPVGQYLLLAGTDEDFKLDNNPLAVQIFYVSNISYIQNGYEYFVLHRETGQPLARANVQLWYRYYHAAARRYAERKGENMVTDKNGYFSIPGSRTGTENNYKLEITTPGDHLFLQDMQYNFRRYVQPPEGERKTTFLFTDRAIYRPGQTVYVKGILVSRHTDVTKTVIVPDFKTTLFLYDANRQKVDSVKVTTNEFGSYFAKFTLPASALNGQFSITDGSTNSHAYISVEEYKRPRFFTEIAQPGDTYRLNDTIMVTGTAKAYAGNTIDGAAVKYRVVRRAIMPLWRYSYGRMIWPPYGNMEVEIVHGETTTDANGNFAISFKAIPDHKIPKKDQPVFTYEISADVTDIAGETRSAAASVSVAYQALQLNLQIPELLHTDSLRRVKISSTNLADSFVKTTVTLSVYRLQTPDRLFRERYWQQPDTFVMSREEYYRYFPYDIYQDEDDRLKWQRGKKVFEITGATVASSDFALRKHTFTPGWYVAEAVTKDKYGEEVKAIQFVQLFTGNRITGPLSAMYITSAHTRLEPGEKAAYEVRTNLDSAFVIHELNKNDDKEQSFFVLDQNSRSFEIPVTEADRGSMGVFTVFVKHNRVYTQSKIFAVPYTNKELTVAYSTYRDKTLPGSEEKWTVTISGYKGEKVAAELLTAMYDASLDQFRKHGWSKPSLWTNHFPFGLWEGRTSFAAVQSQEKYIYIEPVTWLKVYDRLLSGTDNYGFDLERRPLTKRLADRAMPGVPNAAAEVVAEEAVVVVGYGTQRKADATGAIAEEEAPGEPPQNVQPRKNFNETAFFFPDLKTDAQGNITFSFTIPEAVTEWKWMSLAHTKELAFGYTEATIVTQKDLMVQPNAPRFFREGDRMDFSTKIANITDKEMTGQVELQLIDPSTGASVDGWFRNMFPNQYFTAPAKQSVAVNFTIEIPFQYNRPVTYKVIARSGNISDGEEAMLPVVSNRMLVTETLPLPVRGQAGKSFKFEKLLQSGNSETLNHHALTVEFTSNPAWYAVQALPYLMEYPYECSEQIFNRFYANALATSIANASPKLKEMFERWKISSAGEGLEAAAALLSNLQKNEELKSVLLQETPWVLQAKSETEQKKNIALLFDMVRMSHELHSSISKLRDLQLVNGGFVWFKGGRDDLFITQYILTGIGHLEKLKALPGNEALLNNMVNKAISYTDQRFRERYEEMVRLNKGKEPEKGGIGYFEIQYLYMRSFFPEMAVPKNVQKAFNYYRKQAQQHWVPQSRYMQGMIALALHRTGDATTAKNILASLKENALVSEEMGMYWKELSGGYYWYQAPIEAHALLIETFSEIANDTKVVNDLKTWLLKQKQTQHWRTTKATADACYALLLQGSDWFTDTPEITIRLGNQTISSVDQQTEAGTGYFKKAIEGKLVNAGMGNVEVFIKSDNGQTTGRPAWGAVYWQYFEDLDRITPAITPLKLSKKLFVAKNTDRGPVLQPLNEGDELHVGDKVMVRIELRSDRDMEYVHMKDMRAACMEPVNVLSRFKWQGGLGYYESTKDASANFFIGRLPKGTFVFEYPLFVTQTGTFSNGVTTIQCMYAPEFTSHSEGVKVRVE